MSNHSSEEKHWHSYSTTCIRPVPQTLRGFVAYWSMTTTDLVGLHLASFMEWIVDQGSRQVPVTCSINCQPSSFYVQPISKLVFNACGLLFCADFEEGPRTVKHQHQTLTHWPFDYPNIDKSPVFRLRWFHPKPFDVTIWEGHWKEAAQRYLKPKTKWWDKRRRCLPTRSK